MQEVWLKEAVFLAGAPAPPWTALLALALPDRSCLQDVKGMLKYAVRRRGRPRRLACSRGRPRVESRTPVCSAAT